MNVQKAIRTACLALTKAEEKTDDTRYDEGEAEEVEFRDMLPESLLMLWWIEVKVEEQASERDTACWPSHLGL